MTSVLFGVWRVEFSPAQYHYRSVKSIMAWNERMSGCLSRARLNATNRNLFRRTSRVLLSACLPRFTFYNSSCLFTLSLETSKSDASLVRSIATSEFFVFSWWMDGVRTCAKVHEKIRNYDEDNIIYRKLIKCHKIARQIHNLKWLLKILHAILSYFCSSINVQ
jgi:hypothetical protein